jgi:hypothetical protein
MFIFSGSSDHVGGVARPAIAVRAKALNLRSVFAVDTNLAYFHRSPTKTDVQMVQGLAQMRTACNLTFARQHASEPPSPREQRLDIQHQNQDAVRHECARNCGDLLCGVARDIFACCIRLPYTRGRHPSQLRQSSTSLAHRQEDLHGLSKT